MPRDRGALFCLSLSPQQPAHIPEACRRPNTSSKQTNTKTRHAPGTSQTTSLSSESKMSSASCLSPPPLFMAWAFVGCCIRIATQHAAWAAAAASSSSAAADDDDGADLLCRLEPPFTFIHRTTSVCAVSSVSRFRFSWFVCGGYIGQTAMTLAGGSRCLCLRILFSFAPDSDLAVFRSARLPALWRLLSECTSHLLVGRWVMKQAPISPGCTGG